MIALPLSVLIPLYVGVFLTAILLVAAGLRWRDRRRDRPGPRRTRCAVCAFDYVAEAELAPCPRCGSRNERGHPGGL